MANRYFTSEINDDVVFLRGGDAAHIARVLRGRPGQKLTLCDGAGTDYEVEIAAVAPDCIECHVLASAATKNEPALRAEAFIAYGKNDKMDWAVQKAVELGAAAIVPFVSDGCVARPKKDKGDRLQRIAAEAAKQSARGVLPGVEPMLEFDGMLRRAAQNERVLLFHPGGDGRLAEAIEGAASLALITGPESGFSEKEVAKAVSAGCRVVGLGPRILRCETAPVAALAAVMALRGELS